MPSLAAQQQVVQARLAKATAKRIRALWVAIDTRNIDAAWPVFSTRTVRILAAAQRQAAANAKQYLDRAAHADGITDDDHVIVPDGFSGTASDGRSLDTLLLLPKIDAKLRIAHDATPAVAMRGAWIRTYRIADTQVRDAGRIATGAGIVGRREWTGYIRELNPPSCSRCAILAGNYYRWSSGFQRHINCDCVHVPVTSAASGRDAATDPKQYFDSLDTATQNRLFTEDGAQAIRDGADIGQVVNARRGMYTAGGRVFTKEGTTRRGLARRRLTSSGASAATPRLTPEQIYREAAGDRDQAIKQLVRHGYL